MADAHALPGEPVGFFGKLPSHGDFISRGVRDGFLNAWDAWVQRVLVGSRQQLGDRWLQLYMTSPLWRFVLSEDVIDGACWAGVLMPSVDRVGRHFPFTIVAELPPRTPWLAWADTQMLWFTRIEQAALELLEQDLLDLDASAARLPVPVVRDLMPARPGTMNAPGGWSGELREASELTMALAGTLVDQARAALRPVSLWWTTGSDQVAPRWQLLQGLPSDGDFTAMLGGLSQPAGPATVRPQATAQRSPVLAAQPEVPAVEPPPEARRALQWSGAGTTHRGHTRDTNQDAWLGRNEAGCWVVADGMGGHQSGDRASRLVIEGINAKLVSRDSLDALCRQVVDGARAAHAMLRVGVHPDSAGVEAGSTVVALVALRNSACVLWAGDSRLYRWRGGRFEVLTRDHVAYDDPERLSSEITRAVGADTTLELEVRELAAERGDRYLLCSDGVHGALADAELAGIMESASDPATACRSIEAAVLAGPARDNLTAVVVWAA